METFALAGLVTVIFSTVGGFKGVVSTDFILFFAAMIGGIGAAYYCVNLSEVGGMSGLIQHPNVTGKLDITPDLNNPDLVITLLIIPLAVQWWSVGIPGQNQEVEDTLHNVCLPLKRKIMP